MTYKLINKATIVFILFFLMAACIEKRDLYDGKGGGEEEEEEKGGGGDKEPAFTYTSYLYPFENEVQNAVAEITIEANKEINAADITLEIPYLKYNKSWLLMLTQDDCKQAAYCRTWAAINGQPVSNSEQYPTGSSTHDLYYDAAQLQAGDLPPNITPASNTLGSTDGNGKEIRFAITTTLAPEKKWMNAASNVDKGKTDNYYRFYMKSGLVWNNVLEMLNYGTGIAFHDVEVADVNDVADIVKHYGIAQDSIVKRLSGRGCKMLAEPTGYKTYITAAAQYPDIQTLVAQTGTVRLYPFKVTDDLKGTLLHRTINNDPEYFKPVIEAQLKKEKAEREAIHIGVHGTDNAWVELLKWVNSTYGKDGDDSVWLPSQEEYYEYNYYRIHGTATAEQVNKTTVKITVKLPGEKYFYYPATTINVKGIANNDITAISVNDAVTGFSHGTYENGISMNIDCRKFLYEHAVHFVEYYEKDKTNTSRKADALYFTKMLKDSSKKTELLKRVE